MLTEKAARKFNTTDNKPHSEALTFRTAQSVTTGETPAYVNTTLKPFTKPYRVVDISSGVSVPTMEDQNDAPPLPPKEKDLRNDRAEVLNHVYLEPSEETKGIPDQDLANDKIDVVSAAKVRAASSPSLKQSSSNVTDNSPAVRRAPAPRPRSRVPSQFGTLPKPAPRTSRILNDMPVKVDSKEQKVATPPVGKLYCDLNGCDVHCLCRVDFSTTIVTGSSQSLHRSWLSNFFKIIYIQVRKEHPHPHALRFLSSVVKYVLYMYSGIPVSQTLDFSNLQIT